MPITGFFSSTTFPKHNIQKAAKDLESSKPPTNQRRTVKPID